MKVSGSFVLDGPLNNDMSAFIELQEYELRDLFAAFAMFAMQSNGEQLIPSAAAKWAYQQADAMLAARVTITPEGD